MINYDVPIEKDEKKNSRGDAAIYQHRIGRTGRFGAKGIAITLYDRKIDEECLEDIVKVFNLEDKLQKLQGAEHL